MSGEAEFEVNWEGRYTPEAERRVIKQLACEGMWSTALCCEFFADLGVVLWYSGPTSSSSPTRLSLWHCSFQVRLQKLYEISPRRWWTKWPWLQSQKQAFPKCGIWSHWIYRRGAHGRMMLAILNPRYAEQVNILGHRDLNGIKITFL